MGHMPLRVRSTSAGFVAPGFELSERRSSRSPAVARRSPCSRTASRWSTCVRAGVTPARTVPWDVDTLVDVYSVGKPVIALALLILVERGLVALDDPIARHWPEFRTDATVRHALTHTAGLPVFPVKRPVEAWADWDLLCADLAAATPEWPPGTVRGRARADLRPPDRRGRPPGGRPPAGPVRRRGDRRSVRMRLRLRAGARGHRPVRRPGVRRRGLAGPQLRRTRLGQGTRGGEPARRAGRRGGEQRAVAVGVDSGGQSAQPPRWRSPGSTTD